MHFYNATRGKKICFWHFWDSGFACVHSWQEQYPDGWKKGVYWAQCVSLMKCLTRGNHTCMKLEKLYGLLFNSRKNCRIVFFFPQKKAPKISQKCYFYMCFLNSFRRVILFHFTSIRAILVFIALWIDLTISCVLFTFSPD